MAKEGSEIGRWRVGKYLGSGGQSTVYEAFGAEGTEVRAIKLVTLSKSKKRARFIREIRVHAELSEMNAPNIIPIIDHNLKELSEDDNTTKGYIVMPRAVSTMESQSGLFKLRTELCLEAFQGVANGIRIAHSKGAIHRDIKPANVLFLDDSLKTPMVSDFGVCFAKESEENVRITDDNETVGARFFMAPEQERGGKMDVAPSADVYSLGKLLHYMITSRYLYREELSRAFTARELEDDPRLNVIRERLLNRMIIEDHRARIQSAEELVGTASELLESFRHRG